MSPRAWLSLLVFGGLFYAAIAALVLLLVVLR